MTELKYKFTKDTLFKILFVKYPELLKRLVAALLGIEFESIVKFSITNPELTPEELGRKFCRLDIYMIVDDKHVNIEVQVTDEGNFLERTLFYLSRAYSTSIDEGKNFSQLPPTIAINILGFELFDCKEFHSEYKLLEVTRHTHLTDKLVIHFYELVKLPPLKDGDSGRDLWLQLFNAQTEEDLTKIESLGVSFMSEAIVAYRHVATSPEFREAERMRSKARYDEAQALHNAEQRGAETERQHWQVVVADVVAEKDTVIAEKDTVIANQATENEKLRAQLEQFQAKA